MNRVSVANLALSNLGEAPIQNLTDNNARARIASARIDDVIRSVLRMHDWNSAMKRVALTKIDDPLFGYERTRKSQEIMVMYFNDYQTILAGLNTSSEYSHALQLYPNAIPTQMNDLTLEYNGVWDLVLLPNWAEIVAGGGDSNLDGTLNVLDIVGTVAHILGNAELSPEGALAADFNGDGTLNVLDVVATVNAILGND